MLPPQLVGSVLRAGIVSKGYPMPKPGEQVAAAALFLVPEWAVLDGRCATCQSALKRKGQSAFRCDLYDEEIELNYSCESYAPAPVLLAARNRAENGNPTCQEASP